MPSELEAAWAAGRASWPNIPVDEQRFLGFLRERSGTAAMASVRAADLYLACACLDGNEAALGAFAALLDEVAAKLHHMAASDDTLSEAKQIVRQVLVPRGDRPAALAEYSGRGELGGWLRIALGRELVRLRRRQERHQRLDTGEAALLADRQDDPETAYLKAHYQREFKDAFAAALGELADEERRALRYAIVERLSIDQIAQLEGVHRATAARDVARARAQLAEKTRLALQTRLRVEPAQLDSILRLVSSQLDLSVRRLLQDRPPPT
ncbi:MAG TPA: sigma-70 family RNA polymerase sigma factor [Polyangia bacterium]|jgi:RNA polymerase sigma-70 factor (ECF subfamily)